MRTVCVFTCALILTLGTVSTFAHQSPSNQPASMPTFVQPASATQADQETPPPVNLNTATADQLKGLPGIGAATAARILEYRKANGPFKKVEDLMNVRGIGEKTFLTLKPLISVGPPKVGQSRG